METSYWWRSVSPGRSYPPCHSKARRLNNGETPTGESRMFPALVDKRSNTRCYPIFPVGSKGRISFLSRMCLFPGYGLYKPLNIWCFPILTSDTGLVVAVNVLVGWNSRADAHDFFLFFLFFCCGVGCATTSEYTHPFLDRAWCTWLVQNPELWKSASSVVDTLWTQYVDRAGGHNSLVHQRHYDTTPLSHWGRLGKIRSKFACIRVFW